MFTDVEEAEGFLNADNFALRDFGETTVEPVDRRLDLDLGCEILGVPATDDNPFDVSHIGQIEHVPVIPFRASRYPRSVVSVAATALRHRSFTNALLPDHDREVLPIATILGRNLPRCD